ncbi:hypothetical protein D7V82_14665 [bacterium 1xD8-6]|nr:hypothetical protein D7V72_15965 [bacterium D16-36]RKI66556.1 hypothetical protein D7V82_14665 [bacterium 1xD8-6]
MQLNQKAYSVEPDNLIYGHSHPVDADNATVSVPEGTAGVLARGQVLDFSEGAYMPHAEGGKASVIVAEDTAYAEDNTEVTVPVYISGCFRKSACIAGTDLTVSDEEELRAKGIYLK